MILYDVLKMIERDLPEIQFDENGRKEIDSRPKQTYKVRLCFMVEEETWVTVHPDNEILIPWYGCTVIGFTPDEDYTLSIWLDDIPFVEKIFRRDK